MPRPASGRRWFALLLGVCLGIASAGLAAQTESTQKLSRLDRLKRWSAAVERHQPGESDEALALLDDWTSRDLAELQITFYAALALTRDPGVRIFTRPPTGPRRRAPQVFYSRDELRELQAIAARFVPVGANLVLKRGAMLHFDSVVLGSRADSSGRPRRSDYFVFHFSDGQQLNQEDAVGHWDMARFLLDQVQPRKDDLRPDPASDDWVRRWYRTVIAFMLSRIDYHVGIANRSLDIFPDDPELLFLVAVMHETMASSAIQEPLRGVDSTLRASMGVTTRKGELDAAERLLRRAVRRNADFPEARLHLGRVLAESDRHKDALPEITRALASLKNETLLYYGHLFAGRSSAALGDAAAARAAFERAMTLAPAAQSPLLAMSQLAYSRGDTDEAAALMARVADLRALDGDDPWWGYSLSVGRFFEPSRQDLVTTLRAEMAK